MKEATLIVILALIVTFLIVSWVDFLVRNDKDNWFTVLSPIILILWLILVLTF